MHRKKSAVARGHGGINALPDEALQHVLSFLPLQEAVRTCVLSTRWRHLWKTMPILRINCGGRTLVGRGVSKLNKFMSHLLLLRDRRAAVDSFEIELRILKKNEFSSGMLKSKPEPQININLWIRHALLCEARVLRVHLYHYHFGLDDLPLISQHLRKLELCKVVLKDKFLNFSSCPALEELRMDSCCIEADMISSQSVKKLTIIHSTFYWHVPTRISIPTVVTLALTECMGRTPLLDSMPSLVEASVILTSACHERCGKEVFAGNCFKKTCDNCGANGNHTRDCVLLKGLAEARSLEMIAEPTVFILKRDMMWCPTFHNLKSLFLNEWCVALDLHALVCFLQHTPVLERLTLQLSKAHDNWRQMSRNYNLTESFASKKLKVVEVKFEKFDMRVYEILILLSTYGIYIERINMQRSMKSFEHIPQDSGAGHSIAQTQQVSNLENALMKNMIDHTIAQQQEEEGLARIQRQLQLLNQILAQL